MARSRKHMVLRLKHGRMPSMPFLAERAAVLQPYPAKAKITKNKRSSKPYPLKQTILFSTFIFLWDFFPQCVL